MTTIIGRTIAPHGSVRLDRAVVASLLIADVAGVVVDGAERHGTRPVQLVALGLVAATCAAAFGWRRRHPLRVLPVVLLGSIVGPHIHEPALVTQRTGIQLALVVYAVASWSHRRTLAAGVPAVLAGLVSLGTASAGKGFVAVVTIPVALFGAPWFAGYAARMRRQHLADVEERLRRAVTQADEHARLAVAEERAHIARELHDVVAHHISLIGVQAGAARTTLGRSTDDTRAALSGIERSSRQAVHEMRHLLDVLGSTDPNAMAPAPGLAEFDHLCDTYRAAGLTVEHVTVGSFDQLPALQALTLYRIAQEALTNVTRHSAASACTVALCADAREARVVVTDPGPRRPRAPLPPPGAGRGLVGMRQRVDIFGGTLVACAVDGGGYMVDALIPLGPR